MRKITLNERTSNSIIKILQKRLTIPFEILHAYDQDPLSEDIEPAVECVFGDAVVLKHPLYEIYKAKGDKKPPMILLDMTAVFKTYFIEGDIFYFSVDKIVVDSPNNSGAELINYNRKITVINKRSDMIGVDFSIQKESAEEQMISFRPDFDSGEHELVFIPN